MVILGESGIPLKISQTHWMALWQATRESAESNSSVVMKLPAFARFICVLTAALPLSQCAPGRSAAYHANMEDLRNQVKIGENIHSATKRIKGRYHIVTKPHDPTGLGRELHSDVDFGLPVTFLESVAYAADTRPPFDENEPISAIIKARSNGTIVAIE